MKYASSQQGFSLVETLVSITILLIVIVGPMKISSQTARSSSFSSEQVTAFFLAQEGIELFEQAAAGPLLEHFANTNSGNNPWQDISSSGDLDTSSGSDDLDNCYLTTGCGLYLMGESTGVQVKNCPNVGDCDLYYDDRSGASSYYVHSSSYGAKSPFTRKVFLTAVGADEIRVVSTVTWRTGFLRSEQQVSIETRKLNVYGTN